MKRALIQLFLIFAIPAAVFTGVGIWDSIWIDQARAQRQPNDLVGCIVGPLPVTPTAGQLIPLTCNTSGQLQSQNGASVAGTITGVFSGADTTSAVATLAGVAGKTTYICGFNVSGLGLTTGAAVNIAVATLIGGNTANYQYVFPTGATTATTPVQVVYSPCVPANAAATAITVTVPGGAGNTSTNIAAWGFQQ